MTQSAPNHLAQFSDEDLAYHEAGHAVAYHLHGGRISRLSIERRDPQRGTKLTPTDPPLNPGDAADLQRIVSGLLGGEAAMSIHASAQPQIDASGKSDREAALRAAARANMDEPAARAMIDAEWQRTRDRLRQPANWRLVEALAQALLQHKTLDEAQIHQILTSVPPSP